VPKGFGAGAPPVAVVPLVVIMAGTGEPTDRPTDGAAASEAACVATCVRGSLAVPATQLGEGTDAGALVTEDNGDGAGVGAGSAKDACEGATAPPAKAEDPMVALGLEMVPASPPATAPGQSAFMQFAADVIPLEA